MSIVSRAERTLNKLQKLEGCTEDGKNWIICNIDPFHDTDLRLSGYPDMHSEGTVVQLVKESITVSKPQSLAIGDTYDANIVLFPNTANLSAGWVNNFNGSILTGATNDFINTPTGVPTYGALSVNTAPSGQRTFRGVGKPHSSNLSSSGKDLGSTFTRGPFRIIGGGFEVFNDSPEMEKGGSVTVYRVPSNSYKRFVKFSPNNGVLDLRQSSESNYVDVMRMPPGTESEASKLFGSRTWHASQGCYCVLRQNNMNNPLTPTDFPNIAMQLSDFSTGDDGTVIGNTLISNADVTTSSGIADKICPYDISGAYFTGLPSGTTLKVNVHWFIERSPTFSDPSACTLVSPSARYDPIALQMVAAAMVNAPPGVMYKENPFGEWFRSAVDWIGRMAPTIGRGLSSLGVPLAAPIGTAVGAVANVANEIMRPVAINSSSGSGQAYIAPKKKPPNKQAVKKANNKAKSKSK